MARKAVKRGSGSERPLGKTCPAIAWGGTAPKEGAEMARGGRGEKERGVGGATRPSLPLPGPADSFPIRSDENDDQVVAGRQQPFAHLGGPSMLVLLTGGDHMVFSGRQEVGGPPRPNDARHRAIIKAASLAWWDAWLKGDPKAKAWLKDGGMAGFAGGDAAVGWRGPDR